MSTLPLLSPSAASENSTTTFETSSIEQSAIEVYRVATVKIDSAGGSELEEAVKRSLRETWPRVLCYAAGKDVKRPIWAQIRCGFHHSGKAEPTSNSDLLHATIRLYDDDAKHIGGVHAPKECHIKPSFKGGIQKSSYHGEKREHFAFTLTIS